MNKQELLLLLKQAQKIISQNTDEISRNWCIVVDNNLNNASSEIFDLDSIEHNKPWDILVLLAKYKTDFENIIKLYEHEMACGFILGAFSNLICNLYTLKEHKNKDT
jgi:hypothetical protein